MIQIAIFASGNGSNAAKIIEHLKKYEDVSFIVLTNNPKAFVIERAKRLRVEVAIFEKKEFYQGDNVLNFLKCKETDFIVLAGFLWLVPQKFIQAFSNKIINIHPALLPKYGGKGMYGSNVHETVIQNKEEYSGITIHYVNEKYDEGQIVFQEKVALSPNETPASLSQKIQALEHTFFPVVVEELVEEIRKEKLSKEIEKNS